MPESLIDPSPRFIGADLDEVGPMAFGCWRFVDPDVARSRALIEAALERGMNLIDTADVYGFDWGGTGFGMAEEILGSVLAADPSLRDRMVLATKGGIDPGVPYDQSAEYLRGAVEGSLQRLGVDVIDLYQIHRPDLFTHPAALAVTLTRLVDEGKIRAVGVSNMTIHQIDALAEHLPFPIVSNQPEFSAARLEPVRDGTLDQCMRHDMVPLAWSPLAGGSLATGDGVDPDLLAVLDRLAERENVDRATVAFGFVLAHPARPVCILGTQKVERLDTATAALGITLDRNDVYDIVEASDGKPLP